MTFLLLCSLPQDKQANQETDVSLPVLNLTGCNIIQCCKRKLRITLQLFFQVSDIVAKVKPLDFVPCLTRQRLQELSVSHSTKEKYNSDKGQATCSQYQSQYQRSQSPRKRMIVTMNKTYWIMHILKVSWSSVNSRYPQSML